METQVKWITVVHHSKQNGKYYFGCRVMGQSAADAYTVSKTWDSFLDFEKRLCERLPLLAQRQMPRLNRKMALFMKRSILTQRQEDLDLWTRRCCEIPEIKGSSLFVDFFSYDELTCLHVPTRESRRLGMDVGFKYPQTRERLPSLTMLTGQPSHLGHKRSTPNLRYHSDAPELFEARPAPPPPPSSRLHLHPNAQTQALPPPSVPSAVPQPVTPQVDPQQVPSAVSSEVPQAVTSFADWNEAVAKSASQMRSRPSMDSVALSVSTDRTITPSFTTTIREQSEHEDDTPPLQHVFPSKQPRRTPRHFMSLQDIRQTVAPHPAVHVPAPAPVSVPVSVPVSHGSASPLGTRSRASSSASSRSVSQQLELERFNRSSTPSFGHRPPFRKHGHHGSGTSLHSHTPSTSSVTSSDFDHPSHHSDKSSERRLSKDSFAFSSNSSILGPLTPPTPQWVEECSKPERERDFIFSPSLVPLPDTLQFSHPPRGHLSRTCSSSSVTGRTLDPILGSPPMLASIPSMPSTPVTSASTSSITSPFASPLGDWVTLKVRHSAGNVALRVSRQWSCEQVRTKVAEKLVSSGFHPATEPLMPLYLSLPADNQKVLFEGEALWQHASFSATKLVLTC